MSKVSWVNFKQSDFENIQKILEKSYRSGQLTNGGPVVSQLEDFFRNKLKINSDRCVIAVTNGSLALYCLINGINLTEGRNLKYATQAFTFPCANQGPCQDSVIVDMDPGLKTLDVSLVPSDIDGIIVTQLFGNAAPIENLLFWQENSRDSKTKDSKADSKESKKSKLLIFDNATVPYTFHKDVNVNNFGDGSIISLHNTKILGLGEGGLIISLKKYESAIRKCINFGFSLSEGKVNYSPLGINAKMSEIAAGFILDYLSRNWDIIIKHQQELYIKFSKKLSGIKEVELFPHYGSGVPFVSCFALIFNKKINNDHLQMCELSGITARKYYTPIKDLPISKLLFDRILCLPCHPEVDDTTLDRYITLIELLKQDYK